MGVAAGVVTTEEEDREGEEEVHPQRVVPPRMTIYIGGEKRKMEQVVLGGGRTEGVLRAIVYRSIHVTNVTNNQDIGALEPRLSKKTKVVPFPKKEMPLECPCSSASTSLQHTGGFFRPVTRKQLGIPLPQAHRVVRCPPPVRWPRSNVRPSQVFQSPRRTRQAPRAPHAHSATEGTCSLGGIWVAPSSQERAVHATADPQHLEKAPSRGCSARTTATICTGAGAFTRTLGPQRRHTSPAAAAGVRIQIRFDPRRRHEPHAPAAELSQPSKPTDEEPPPPTPSSADSSPRESTLHTTAANLRTPLVHAGSCRSMHCRARRPFGKPAPPRRCLARRSYASLVRLTRPPHSSAPHVRPTRPPNPANTTGSAVPETAGPHGRRRCLEINHAATGVRDIPCDTSLTARAKNGTSSASPPHPRTWLPAPRSPTAAPRASLATSTSRSRAAGTSTLRCYPPPHPVWRPPHPHDIRLPQHGGGRILDRRLRQQRPPAGKQTWSYTSLLTTVMYEDGSVSLAPSPSHPAVPAPLPYCPGDRNAAEGKKESSFEGKSSTHRAHGPRPRRESSYWQQRRVCGPAWEV
ncbi:hypothetical protein C8R47DRAFT_1204336 [Mycena vitilis]|nr:hypothetical protein C8R47DRAFT_1204336 [Mycena vitilis]